MQVAGEARAFRHPRSPLERALNRLLLVLVAIIAPLGLILGAALWERRTPISSAVPTSVAAVVTLVPEGLILLVSLTFAVARADVAGAAALAQQLNAVESLASVDVVCLDKTGTLTDRACACSASCRPTASPRTSSRTRVGQYAASAPAPNATLEALAAAYPAEGAEPDAWCRSRPGVASARSHSTATRTCSGRPSSSCWAPLEERAEPSRGRRTPRRRARPSRLPARHEPERLPDDVAARPGRHRGAAAPEPRDRRLPSPSGRRAEDPLGRPPATVAAIAADVGIPAARAVDGRELPE